MWEAVPPPPGAKHIPFNTLSRSRKGHGAAGVRNTDHDGDLFSFSNDKRILDFCDATLEGMQAKEFIEAEARVKASLSKVPEAPFSSTAAFRDFILEVDALPVRASCKLFVSEFHRSRDPRLDGLLVAAVELGAYAHAAMDVPKKYLATEVVSKARMRLKSAGLWQKGRKVSATLLMKLKFLPDKEDQWVGVGQRDEATSLARRGSAIPKSVYRERQAPRIGAFFSIPSLAARKWPQKSYESLSRRYLPSSHIKCANAGTFARVNGFKEFRTPSGVMVSSVSQSCCFMLQ